jgi:hypothetical protein
VISTRSPRSLRMCSTRSLVLAALCSLGPLTAGCESCLGDPPAPPPSAEDGDHSADPALTLGLDPEVAQRTVAVVDGEELRVIDVAYAIDDLAPIAAARAADAERRRELVEAMVVERALAAEARDRGLDEDPRVARAREEAFVRTLVEQVEREVPAPTEAEVRGYYDSHRERYRAPELRSVSLLFTRDEAGGRAALARMGADTRHIPQAWRDVADQIGFMGPLAYPVEETEMFAREPREGEGNIPQEIRDIAFASEVPSLHPELVPFHDGWYLVRTVSRTDPTDASFEDVRDHIREELHAEQVDARVTQLVGETLSQASFDDEALDSVRIPVWQPLVGPRPH